MTHNGVDSMSMTHEIRCQGDAAELGQMLCFRRIRIMSMVS